MNYKTLNKTIFNFYIDVPVFESVLEKDEQMIVEESYDLKDYYPLRNIKRPSLKDFHIGDLVKFHDETENGTIMTVVGYLKPFYVKVISSFEDITGDYKTYYVYPEDLEEVSNNGVHEKGLLNCYSF